MSHKSKRIIAAICGTVSLAVTIFSISLLIISSDSQHRSGTPGAEPTKTEVGGVTPPDPTESGVWPSGPATSGAVDVAVWEGANAALSGIFDSSLEMRENVDFILTPGLIIQEALIPGVVPTYPQE